MSFSPNRLLPHFVWSGNGKGAEITKIQPVYAAAEPARLEAEIKALEVKQKALGVTIVERMTAGHQKIPALDAALDELEKQRLALQECLDQLPPG